MGRDRTMEAVRIDRRERRNSYVDECTFDCFFLSQNFPKFFEGGPPFSNELLILSMPSGDLE